MSNYTKLYWLTRLDSIHGLFIAMFVIGILVTLVYHVGYAAANDINSFDDDEKKSWKKNQNWLLVMGKIFIPVGIVCMCLLPSRDEMIIIYAGGKTMDFVSKDTSINKIPAQTTKIITDYLQHCLTETKDKKKD